MNKINSKNAERHILLATTDLKERGVVVPATVAKEAVEMAEQELKDKAMEWFRDFVTNYAFEAGHTEIEKGAEHYVKIFTQKLNEQ